MAACKRVTKSPEIPHFRKILVQNTLYQDKLRIPKEFMKRYGVNISSPVLIKVPISGGEWEMELTERDENGDVWLCKGWPEFSVHYGLEYGQSLVFSYNGNSRFDLVIFGKYGLEIDYPVSPGANFQFNDSDIETNNIDSPPRKKMNLDLRGEFESLADEKSNEPMTVYEKNIALSRTKEFASLNPHFKVVIEKSHVHDCYDLVVSPEFWIEHLSDKSGHSVILYVSHRKSWLVKLDDPRTMSIGTRGLRPSFVKNDWKEFVKDNNLEIGDVCIFELINKNEVFLKVSIFRTTDGLKTPKVTRADNKSTQTREKDSEHQGRRQLPENSGKRFVTSGYVTHYSPSSSTDTTYFEVKLRKCHCEKGLSIRHLFAKKHFEKAVQNVKLQVGKILWEVKLVVPRGRFFLSAGWLRFVKDNHLRPGDFCLFEFVGKDENNQAVLRVTISRI